MSDALEPKTVSVKARDWMTNVLPTVLAACIISVGGSYFAMRNSVAVLEEKYSVLLDQQMRIAEDQKQAARENRQAMKELRDELRCVIGTLYTKDEHNQYNEMITQRLKDYTSRFIDVRVTMSDHAERLRALESEKRARQ